VQNASTIDSATTLCAKSHLCSRPPQPPVYLTVQSHSALGDLLQNSFHQQRLEKTKTASKYPAPVPKEKSHTTSLSPSTTATQPALPNSPLRHRTHRNDPRPTLRRLVMLPNMRLDLRARHHTPHTLQPGRLRARRALHIPRYARFRDVAGPPRRRHSHGSPRPRALRPSHATLPLGRHKAEHIVHNSN
jgi:hypothetical protein